MAWSVIHNIIIFWTWFLLLVSWNMPRVKSWGPRHHQGCGYSSESKTKTSISIRGRPMPRPLLASIDLPNEENNSSKDDGYLQRVVLGPDIATKPDYENIHGPLGKTMDSIFLQVFRSKLAEYVGVDSRLPKVRSKGIYQCFCI